MMDSDKIERKKGSEEKFDSSKLDRPGKQKCCQSPPSDCFQSLGGTNRFVLYESVSVCVYLQKKDNCPVSGG